MSAPALAVQVQGQFQVGADNLNTYEQTCDNFTQLRAFIGVPGIQVFTRGVTSPGDGGQGPFYWSAGNPSPDDNFNVIVPIGGGGAWIRLPGFGGTITGIVTTNGISGGAPSGIVTLSLTPIASQDILANLTNSAAPPSGNTLSDILDTLSATSGSIIYRGASTWAALGPGPTGYVLTANGPGSPTWNAPSGSGGISLLATENIAAGSLVNIWNSGGIAKIRNANATDATKPADGFVTTVVTSGNPGAVFNLGQISGLVGLTPGSYYYLSTTPGIASLAAPNTSGNLVQQVGKAISDTNLLFTYQEGIQL